MVTEGQGAGTTPPLELRALPLRNTACQLTQKEAENTVKVHRSAHTVCLYLALQIHICLYVAHTRSRKMYQRLVRDQLWAKGPGLETRRILHLCYLVCQQALLNTRALNHTEILDLKNKSLQVSYF